MAIRRGDRASRRAAQRVRRYRDAEPRPDARPDALAIPGAKAPESRGELARAGWDLDAENAEPSRPATRDTSTPLTAQVLSLFADPRVRSVSAVSAARLLGVPRTDVQTALDALTQAGELERDPAGSDRYQVSEERKQEFELMFRDAAEDLGETTALARMDAQRALAVDEDEEPRLPVTAGLLSLFLPGTGQLLNGDVGRASLVFAVWSLALLTHLNPIWTFVALYAGAEAFFTAKIRGMERKLALESGKGPGSKPDTTPGLNRA